MGFKFILYTVIAVFLCFAPVLAAQQAELRLVGDVSSSVRGDPRIEARAVEILNKSDAVFARTKQLSVVYVESVRGSTRRDTTTLRLARPNLFFVDETKTHVFERTRKRRGRTTTVMDTTVINTVHASDGTARWEISKWAAKGKKEEVGCSVADIAPANDGRELGTYNPIYWSFYDLGQWHFRSAVLGHWSTKSRLNDPGLRSVTYVGRYTAAGVPVDIIEWVYTIAYNYREDDPVYTTRLHIADDGFPRRITTTSSGAVRRDEYDRQAVVAEIRAGDWVNPADYEFTPPAGAECTRVEDGMRTMAANPKYADRPVGSVASDFTLATSTGDTITLSDLVRRNKGILLNWWGYGCDGCRVELPHLEKLYREFKDKGFMVVTITHDSASSVRRMVDYNGITHPILIETADPVKGQAYEKYGAYDGKHYFINSEGRITAVYSKVGISIPLIRQELAKLGIE